MRYGGPRGLTVAQQFVNLRANPACRGTGTLRAGRLVWRYEVQPTPLSRSYTLELVYQQGKSPDVFVVEPDLTELADGRKLPHVYQQKPTELCLYLPGSGEWSSSKRMDQTIVPWAALWLFYFEEWLVSRQWKGGGKHPERTKHARNYTNFR